MKKTMTLLMTMVFAVLLFTSGCGKKVIDNTTTDPVIYDNMSENITVSQNDTVIVDPVVIVNSMNLTITNDTTVVPVQNDTIVIEDDTTNSNSEYSEYRDTELIDDSIDDIESMD